MKVELVSKETEKQCRENYERVLKEKEERKTRVSSFLFAIPLLLQVPLHGFLIFICGSGFANASWIVTKIIYFLATSFFGLTAFGSALFGSIFLYQGCVGALQLLIHKNDLITAKFQLSQIEGQHFLMNQVDCVEKDACMTESVLNPTAQEKIETLKKMKETLITTEEEKEKKLIK